MRRVVCGTFVVACAMGGSVVLAGLAHSDGAGGECASFANWSEAQAAFERGDLTPSADADRDGNACEGLAGTPSGSPSPRSSSGGYLLAAVNGTVFGFGDMLPVTPRTSGPITAIAAADNGGYWLLARSGVVFARGVAHHGNPVLGPGDGTPTAIAGSPDGSGYWVFTSTGKVFAYGAVAHYGDMSAVRLNGAIVAATTTPTGRGYWMVGSDGGIFSFGDARFFGSTGDRSVSAPVVGIIGDPDGNGYWLVGSDGAVYPFSSPSYGDVPSVLAPGQRLNQPIVGGLAVGSGYLLVAADGGTFAFGDQPFLGSLGGRGAPHRIVGVAIRAGISEPDSDVPTTTEPDAVTTTTVDSETEGVDSDGDGLTDEEELLLGSDPNLFDTDADGLDDSYEAALGTNPRAVDSDGGGVSDGDEIESYGTDPLDPGDDSTVL